MRIDESNQPTDERSGEDGLMLKDRVRELRLARGMTQQQLAAKARITQPALSGIETGETKSLAGETLVYLARALDESPEYIQTGRRSVKSSVDDELVAVSLRLTPANRALVLQLARSLVSQQPQPNAGGSGPDHHNEVAAQIRQTIVEMIDAYGSDTVARALADNQSAVGEPSKRTGKHKA